MNSIPTETMASFLAKKWPKPTSKEKRNTSSTKNNSNHKKTNLLKAKCPPLPASKIFQCILQQKATVDTPKRSAIATNCLRFPIKTTFSMKLTNSTEVALGFMMLSPEIRTAPMKPLKNCHHFPLKNIKAWSSVHAPTTNLSKRIKSETY